MSTVNLKTSDLVSGVICVAYDNFAGIPSNNMTRFTEQVAHRVIGRSANQLTSLPPMEFVVSENDIYTAGVAGLFIYPCVIACPVSFCLFALYVRFLLILLTFPSNNYLLTFLGHMV
jgi:hypothetical protein